VKIVGARHAVPLQVGIRIIMKIKMIICFGLLLILQTSAYAILNLELTKGVDRAIPIAAIPFKFQGNQQLPLDVTTIISQDLQNSGRFKLLDVKEMQQTPSDINNVDFQYWKDKGVDDLVLGKIQSYGNNKYQISFSLLNIYKHFKKKSFFDASPVLAKETYVVMAKDLRKLAHKISDIIYAKLTGERGIFSTKIAYILVDRTPNQPRKYSLIVSDSDGYNPQAILTSSQPIMSPAWSPDGKSIAYVSFENRRATLFVSNVTTGARRVITSFPGINGAPTWSPDGKHLAVVLSKNGGAKIFLVDLHNGKLSQLTNGWLIDTEPCFSPDGKSILFTSDRAGSPQIYLRDLASGSLRRLTFVGNYNARASFTPDKKSIVMLHRDQGSFNIAIQDLQTGVVTILAGVCDNQSPSIAPNGRMIIYASHDGNKGLLALVSTDGKVRLNLPETNGEVREPAWSPFLSSKQ